jgi:hypothetical protein
MVVGLLIIGMAFGAAAAGGWILSGGSILAALGLYSVVSTTTVLTWAVAAHALSRRRTEAAAKSLQAAE